MAIDPSAVGASAGSWEWSWGPSDCILYALGVGAGRDELAFVTEDSEGFAQAVLPTFAVLGGPRRPPPEIVGPYDPAMLVHGEHVLELAGPIPVRGAVCTTSTIVGIWDKGSGALVVSEARSVDAATGVWRFTNRASAFIRGEGGWGGRRGTSGGPAAGASAAAAGASAAAAGASPRPPSRPPDEVVSFETSPDQALLYRLSGDRNPLHSDPSYARRAGFDRPILHGLCTWGFTGRALLARLCGSDPAALRSMEGRFAAPVYPGDRLTVSIWAEGDRAQFVTAARDGEVVLARGGCTLA